MDSKNLLGHNIANTKLFISALLIFVITTLTGFVSINKNVKILADGNEIVINTVYNNPKSVLKQVGIKLNDHDDLTVSTELLNNDSVITVNRAFPVEVSIDGVNQKVYTTKNNVDDLLHQMRLNPNDYYVDHKHNTHLHTNSKINLLKVDSKLILRDTVEKFQVVYKKDSSIPRGQTVVKQEGENGLSRKLVREKYYKNTKIDEDIVQTSELVRPVNRIILEGTAEPKKMIHNRPYSKMIHMHASAYLPHDGGGSGITATGVRARRGIVAVDPNVIPLGTRLYIPGYGEALAADTGGAIRGNKIDLVMESYSEAINFGRRGVEVYILE